MTGILMLYVAVLVAYGFEHLTAQSERDQLQD